VPSWGECWCGSRGRGCLKPCQLSNALEPPQSILQLGPPIMGSAGSSTKFPLSKLPLQRRLGPPGAWGPMNVERMMTTNRINKRIQKMRRLIMSLPDEATGKVTPDEERIPPAALLLVISHGSGSKLRLPSYRPSAAPTDPS